MQEPKQRKPYTGPVCGAKTRKGGLCQHKPGFRTDHPGEGRCYLHGGKTPIQHGRYSKINRPRIKELIEQFEADPDPMNLLPEVQLLRALIQDYIERYDEYTEALIFWWDAEINPHLYEDEVKRYVMWLEGQLRFAQKQSVSLLSMATSEATPALLDAIEAYCEVLHENKPKDEKPDRPTRYSKPRKIIDILQVGNFIGQIGTIVEKVNKQKEKQSVSLVDLHRVMGALGEEVVGAVLEVIPDADLGTRLIESIQNRWNSIRLEPGNPGGRGDK